MTTLPNFANPVPPFATPAQTTTAPVVEMVAPVAPVAAPVAPVAVAVAPTTEVKKERKKRTKPEIELDPVKIKFVRANIRAMSVAEISEKTGLTKSQVNSVLQTMKKKLRDMVITQSETAGILPYERHTDPEKKGRYDYSKPLTEQAKKVEAGIDQLLSRPPEARPGAGGPRNTVVAAAIDSEIADLLSIIGQ